MDSLHVRKLEHHGRFIVPAYFIVQNTIKDEAQYQKYVQAVVPFIASFGGKLVARRAKVEFWKANMMSVRL